MKIDRYAVARGLGWFSIGLGLVEVFGGKKVARALGLEHRTGLLRLFGIREIVAGVGILAGTRTKPWLWARVAGDALDLGLLATALDPRNKKRGAAAIAISSVLGVTAADIATGCTVEA